MKALRNISMLLFLCFVKNSVKTGEIDLLNIEKIRGNEGKQNTSFQKYKSYIKYCQFDNIIKDGKFNKDLEECKFPIIIEFIFRHILQIHPKTKNIFADEIPNIKNDVTYVKIFKEMEKIKWDELDLDIKVLAYEHFLNYESDGGELGQFFTKREVVDYMVNKIKPYIKETSTFIDPFCGTGSFIIKMFSIIKEIYRKKNIPFTDEIKNNLTHGIEKNPQTCLLALNNMLLNMDLFPTNVKCDDSFRNYIDKQYDFVITNPPFILKGLTYDDESMFPEDYNGITKKKYFPHKTNDAICLALQMIPFILNKRGICAVVVPDGKQMTSDKEKSLVAVRKNLIENTNLFQITKLPAGTFLPYTGVETMILFFKKGEKTENIKFVKLDDKYKNEIILCNVNIDKIIEQNYSLNYKLYIEVENKYAGIKYEIIDNLCDINFNTKIVKSDCSDECDEALYTDNYSISEFGVSENNVRIIASKLWLNSCGLILNVKNDIIIQKYIELYLSINNKILIDLGKGTAQKNLDIDAFKNLQIPIPSIPIQNLIVQELDSMYKQKESLQTTNNEMNNYRKVQFDILLSKSKDLLSEKLGNIVTMKAGKFNSGNKLTEGKYKFFTSDAVQPSGYYNEYCFEGDEYLILIKDGESNNNTGLGKNFLIKQEKTAATRHQLALYMNDGYKNQINYIHKYLLIKKKSIMDLAHYTNGLGCISMEKLKQFEVLIPPLKEQESIVQQMDKYDQLVKLQQARINEIDTTIKDRFEFHLNKCKETNQTNKQEVKQNDENGQALQSEKSFKDKLGIEDSKAKFTKSTKSTKIKKTTKMTKTKDKIIKEISKSNLSTNKLDKKYNASDDFDEEDEIITYTIGKVECICENGYYYKFINGKKGELYAKTVNGKVILHKNTESSKT